MDKREGIYYGGVSKAPMCESSGGSREQTQVAGASVRTGLVTLENVERCFTYHPWSRYQGELGDQVCEVLIHAAKTILRVVPGGPDRSAAIRKLRECRMDCNSAITHDGEF